MAGLLVSVFGLTATWRQAWRARDAATKAQIAAGRAAAAVELRQSAAEFAELRASLRELRLLIRAASSEMPLQMDSQSLLDIAKAQMWHNLSDKVEFSRRLAARIQSAQGHRLPLPERERLDQFTFWLPRLQEELEGAARAKSKSIPDTAAHVARLSHFLDEFEKFRGFESLGDGELK